MSTVINNPNGEDSSGFGGMLVGIVLVIVVIALFFMFVLPGIRGNNDAPRNDTIDVNVDLPTGGDNGSGSNAPAPAPAE